MEQLEFTNCAYLSTNVDLVVVVVVVVVVTVVLRLGHFCTLQVLVSNGDPEHLLPPFLAIWATVRVLVCVPVLHDAVHGDQSLKSVHWQSKNKKIK